MEISVEQLIISFSWIANAALFHHEFVTDMINDGEYKYSSEIVFVVINTSILWFCLYKLIYYIDSINMYGELSFFVLGCFLMMKLDRFIKKYFERDV